LFVLTFAALLGITQVQQVLALSDETIKQRIEGAAANMAQLRGTKVVIIVEDCYVILSGAVRLYSQKMTYERITWQTMGVLEVENEISVVPLVPLPDADIERKIREIVKTYPRFQGVQLKIRVQEGSVFLRAIFEHPRDVLFLKHRVAEIEGVTAIQIEAAFRV
jgi:osmotically-inducible protein OsmY